MKSRLYICIKNPLSNRDVDRFGISELSEKYDLRILDCTAWLMPTALSTRIGVSLDLPNLRRIATFKEFKSEIDTHGFAIDYVGAFSPKAILMFEALRQRCIRLIVIDSGAFPEPEVIFGRRSLSSKLLNTLRYGGFRTHLLARFNRLLLWLLPDQRPDLALVAGESWRTNPRFANARIQMAAHSFDYERFRALLSLPLPAMICKMTPFVVYIDEDIAGHEDNVELGLTSPTREGIFYPALNRFFDRFEQLTGFAVVIAGYPSNRQRASELFGGRQVILNMTAELVSASRVVFAHASTSISFAVLWRRPLVFLTSTDIKSSWYGEWINSPRLLLGASLIDLDLQSDLPDFETINEAAYISYEQNFIRSTERPDASLWDLLDSGIRKLEKDR